MGALILALVGLIASLGSICHRLRRSECTRGGGFRVSLTRSNSQNIDVEHSRQGSGGSQLTKDEYENLHEMLERAVGERLRDIGNQVSEV